MATRNSIGVFIMPQDHRTSKEDFPLAEAKRLRAEGQSIQAVADAIGWSFAQTRRKLLASTKPASANATQTKVQPANPATPTTEKIPIADIIVDAGTQMRQSLNLSTIAEYTEAMEEGSKFPPIVVFSDGGSYWLADGFQRIEAAKVVGYRDIEAQVRPGTLRDAILHACSANATHGERRTNADKRKSVLTLLHDPEQPHRVELCLRPEL